MSIKSEITRITNEVTAQETLIEEILLELEGKAAGGSGGITPSGTKEITENGQYDVTEFAGVNVNVPIGGVVKSGTTTSATINTGLTKIKQFFIYKEVVSSTGLIHLHYSEEAGTSFLYASAWSTQNYGTKTIQNKTTNANVNGGTITLPSTSATSGGLSSGVTYKWIAIGE